MFSLHAAVCCAFHTCIQLPQCMRTCNSVLFPGCGTRPPGPESGPRAREAHFIQKKLGAPNLFRRGLSRAGRQVPFYSVSRGGGSGLRGLAGRQDPFYSVSRGGGPWLRGLVGRQGPFYSLSRGRGKGSLEAYKAPLAPLPRPRETE